MESIQERKVVHGDEQFEHFRRYLADKVTVAINQGIEVTTDGWSDRDTCCPLGVLPGSGGKRPNGAMARRDPVIGDLPHM